MIGWARAGVQDFLLRLWDLFFFDFLEKLSVFFWWSCFSFSSWKEQTLGLTYKGVTYVTSTPHPSRVVNEGCWKGSRSKDIRILVVTVTVRGPRLTYTYVLFMLVSLIFSIRDGFAAVAGWNNHFEWMGMVTSQGWLVCIELPSSTTNLEVLQMLDIWNSGGYEYEEFFLRRKQVVIFDMEDSLYGFLCLRTYDHWIEPDSWFCRKFPNRMNFGSCFPVGNGPIRCFA